MKKTRAGGRSKGQGVTEMGRKAALKESELEEPGGYVMINSDLFVKPDFSREDDDSDGDPQYSMQFTLENAPPGWSDGLERGAEIEAGFLPGCVVMFRLRLPEGGVSPHKMLMLSASALEMLLDVEDTLPMIH
jgi:hypothetical protein